MVRNVKNRSGQNLNRGDVQDFRCNIRGTVLLEGSSLRRVIFWKVLFCGGNILEGSYLKNILFWKTLF